MPIHPQTIINPHQHMLGHIYEPIVLLRLEMIFTSSLSRIDAFCKIEGGDGVFIGDHVHVASYCHLNIGGGTLTMEEGSSCGSGCRIVTGSNKYGPGHGCSAIAPDAIVERSFVTLKRNATLYAGCLVRPGVTIGEGATVAMGSVVLCDVTAGELWGGNPARRLRDAVGNRSQPIPVSVPVPCGPDVVGVLKPGVYVGQVGSEEFVRSQYDFYDWS